jgi:hypothetical protein
VGAAVRTGDAMFGLAIVESTRPTCEGTAAATLLNMMVVRVAVGGGSKCLVLWLMSFGVDRGCGRGGVDVWQIVIVTMMGKVI